MRFEFNTLKEVLEDLIDNQTLKCNKLIKTDSNCNPASDQRLLTKYKRAYLEYLELIYFCEKYFNEEDDQFE